MTSINRPVTPSAARHAALIRERDARKAKEKGGQADGRQTYELYAERALAVARADEELRRQAAENDRRARGQWVPGDLTEDDDGNDEQAADVTDNPERRAARTAHRGIVAHAYEQAMRAGRGFVG
ncbi:hypothetical protein E2C11_11065 [Streptomyces lavendulae]|nr:hypothetical protein [Streptomyces lavendulae]TXJ80680.1 hypothetical protein E2C11_11065 [Streptomyces lavendulae]